MEIYVYNQVKKHLPMGNENKGGSTGGYSVTQDILPNVYFECNGISEKMVALGETVEVRFRVGGRNDDVKRAVKFTVSDASICSLSTTEWSAENEWILRTKITGLKVGNTIIQVEVEGKKRNLLRVACKTLANDVFSETDINRLIAQNAISLASPKLNPCIVAADKQLGKLLVNTTDFITDTSTNKANVYTAYTRIEQITAKGFVASSKIFDQHVFQNGGYTKPTLYSAGNEQVVSTYLLAAIGSKQGFHVFYFTILNGYHVLTLIVDAHDLCKMKYKIYDQLRDRGDYIAFS
jgi:hypothetical protein